VKLAIPQADPRANYLARKEEIDAAITKVLASGVYILGREVEAFEREFAEYLGVSQAIGVASGTDALALALRACGIQPGDAVITVSHTAVATVAAIESSGATPIFADIDASTFTMSPESVEKILQTAHSQCIKAIVPVHLYGHPADMERLTGIAQRYSIAVIEDCAQAHGALLSGRKVGTWGMAAAFSFYPTKNLAALGDGGAIVTNNPEVAKKATLLRQYGWGERYVSDVAGTNSRLDELQAGILRVKLRYLDDDNSRRRQIASSYNTNLAGLGLRLPTQLSGAEQVFHQYVIRTRAREALRSRLAEVGIGAAIHYPVPVHLQPAYRHYSDTNIKLPITEDVAGEILSLPMFPELTHAAVEAITAAIRSSV
jgi:dTDP-4-amino-4,6-dideoxygalactose transaminase